MNISREEENLIRARKVVDDEVLPRLRAYFKQRWNGQKDTTQVAWSDSNNDGKALLPKIRCHNPKAEKLIKDRIESGNTEEWDATCLFEAILALGIGKRAASVIGDLRKLRNMLSHLSHGTFSDTEKDHFFTAIRDAYKKLSWPEDDVIKIETAPIATEEMKKLKSQLESEKRKALKENQENACQLRKKLKTFVGRATEVKEVKEKLSKGDTFIIITGGPCYGKSSLANEIGHAIFNDSEHSKIKYNYVIWINMRDISNPPQIEDIADKILKEFGIDTTEMKGEVVEILKRKFELITATGKRALLIFDNADDLISPQIDKSCKSSTFTELSRHIRGYSRETIRAVFTTRVYNKIASNEDHYIVKLDHFSDEESKDYLQQELEEKIDLDKERIMRDIVKACHGLPFALKLVCSYINDIRSIQIIEDYVNDLTKDPLQTVGEDEQLDDDIHLFACFDLSLKRLDKNDIKLLSLLAVFPSRFSYTYVKKIISSVGKDDTISPRKQLIKFEKHSLIQDDSHADETNRDKSSSGQYYVIHSFFCQYIKDQYWKGNDRQSYESSYCKLYTNELFVLGRKSLEKDNYAECWKEFEAEQHNFLYVMVEIGKGCEQVDCPSDIEEAVREVLKRETPDFIAVLLFCAGLVNPSLLSQLFEAYEQLAEDKRKKNIWCCRYDLNVKYFDKEIDDPYRKLKPDEYGRALLDKRSLNKKVHSPFQIDGSKEEAFKLIDNELKEFNARVDNLQCVTLKNYFKYKIRKLSGTLQKKCLKVEELNVRQDHCITALSDALEICMEHFGKSWLTIDSYNQLGKAFWSVKDHQKAIVEFDKAMELAGSMSLKSVKKFGSCLLDKGRFLIDLGIEEKVEEGRALLEESIKLCNDAADTKFWCRTMEYLLKVDSSKVIEVKDQFSQTDTPNSALLDLMDTAIKLDADSFNEDFEGEKSLEQENAKVRDLRNAIMKVQEMQNDKILIQAPVRHERIPLSENVRKRLFVWQMMAALSYSHVLPLSERKAFARNALDLMEQHESIHRGGKERELLSLVNQDWDANEEEMIRQMHYIDRIGKQLMNEGKKDELMERYSTLLMKCEGHQKLWSFIVLETSKSIPFILEKVTKLFIAQSEPCEDLLKLVHCKFSYDIKIYNREANENIIIGKSRRAVEDLKRAIEHVERLLEATNAGEVVKRLKANLRCWYKCIALNADHCLLDSERSVYVEVLRSAFDLDITEKKRLESLISRACTKEEQEKRRKKSLLCKVTKFMRENDMQEDLEKRYEKFMIECASFPQLRFEMVKFILKNSNIEIQKFGKYLRYLLRHFEEGIFNGWDYQFIIDLADELFLTDIDHSSRVENIDIYQSIFRSLQCSKLNKGLRIKLEFEFLVIIVLKAGKNNRDVSIKKQYARRALGIFKNIEQKYKDAKLCGYEKQLSELLKQ